MASLARWLVQSPSVRPSVVRLLALPSVIALGFLSKESSAASGGPQYICTGKTIVSVCLLLGLLSPLLLPAASG